MHLSRRPGIFQSTHIQEGTNTNCSITVFITTYENIHLQRVPSTPGIIPNKIVDAESVNTFKTRYKYWSDQPVLYDFKDEIAESEIDQNVILKFSLDISLVCNKDTDIEAQKEFRKGPPTIFCLWKG